MELDPNTHKARGKITRFYERVTRVHLEVTARCNAACPQCHRNYSGGPKRINVQELELSLEDVKRILPVSFLQQLNLLYVNGNYGDGAVAKDIVEIFTYLREASPRLHLMLFTNGSVHTPDWWERLGGIINEIYWGIDGLEDTNHIYRRHTSFKKIIANAEAFNKTADKSVWVFNVFKHNEHQVEEARELSKKLGFTDFVVRKTARFEFNGKLYNKLPVFSKTGALEYFLEAPSSDKFVNEGYEIFDGTDEAMQATLERIMTYDKGVQDGQIKVSPTEVPDSYLAVEVDIGCLAQKEESVFVSASGHVHPCCWLGSYTPLQDPAIHELKALEDSIPSGLDALNAKIHPISEIIENLYYQKVQQSWEKGSAKNGVLMMCSRQCGSHKGNCYSKQVDAT